MSVSDRLYFRQLLAGRDYAVGDPIAAQMRNFAYVIGDRESGHCVVVDPAYAATDLVDQVEADGLRVSGVLVTHHHPDHVGGTMFGFTSWPDGTVGAQQCSSARQHTRAELGRQHHRDSQ